MMMKYYETLYLVNPNLADEDYKDVLTKFSALIEKNKGVLIKSDEWGKKSLAYPVKKFDRGYYVLLQYCGEPSITSDLRRDLKLDDRILKYQTVKLSDSADPEKLIREAQDSVEKVVEQPETAEKVGSEGLEKEVENGV